ncbi:MAG: efflux RND transporter periplasmic adaptor subunit [Candidatus Schekmanbacteria bacterium]|nr:MAG: efflux RND transporter periplasmic adaptor subunit [Candidatus Schekmanbacteria bacterium]
MSKRGNIFGIIITALIIISLIAVGIIYKDKLFKSNIQTATSDKKEGTVKTTEAKEDEGKGKRKILYWRAPMDPTYISDKPGKSPMGMDLIPVYEGEEPEAAGIKIDPVTVQNIGVKTERAKKIRLRKEIRTIGRVDYDERKITDVTTKIEGWIEKLYVDFTGQEVKKGQPLIEIYSPELVSTQEEYLLALKYKKNLQNNPFSEIAKGAESLLASTRKRLELWDISDAQIKELEQTGQVQKRMVINALSRGIVIDKMALEGMYVKNGMSLYRLADISTVWVYADIYEYELPFIKKGQKATMTLSYLPGKKFTGRVTYIYPYLEEKTRTVKVRLEFPNPQWELKPGMYADVVIESDLGREGVVVPSYAVIRSGKRNIVVLNKGNGLFEPREVTLGVEAADGYIEIAEGVKEGEEIVTSSHFLIDSESNLQEAIQKMLETKKDNRMDIEHSDMDMSDMTMDDEDMDMNEMNME